MEQRVIDATVIQDTFVASYLTIFAHGLKLTDSEFKVLEQIVKVYMDLEGQVKEPFLTELVLATDRRIEIREATGIDESSFNNIIASLKKKKIITSAGLNPMLLPAESVVFNFIVDGERPIVTATKAREERPKSVQEVTLNNQTEVVKEPRVQITDTKPSTVIEEIKEELAQVSHPTVVDEQPTTITTTPNRSILDDINEEEISSEDYESDSMIDPDSNPYLDAKEDGHKYGEQDYDRNTSIMAVKVS